MSRFYAKTNGQIPKKMYIHQYLNGKNGCLLGPYFTNVRAEDGYTKIEYILDEETGDYLRNPPLKPRVKGAKIKLDI